MGDGTGHGCAQPLHERTDLATGSEAWFRMSLAGVRF
jgi:hypothetical protein